MEIIGYTDRLTAAPGDTIQFKVSATVPEYEAKIVRLIHGDVNPIGPGFKEEELATSVDGVYPGCEQPLRPGSYVRVPDSAPLRLTGSFTITAWIWPTLPGKGGQALVTKWDEAAQTGYGMMLDETGSLALWMGDGDEIVRIEMKRPLHPRTWYFVVVSLDAELGVARLRQEPLHYWPRDESDIGMHYDTELRPAANSAPLLMAAYAAETGPVGVVTAGHYNGKLESPSVFGRFLSDREADALKRGEWPQEVKTATISAWDFSTGISGTAVHDTGPFSLQGVTVHMPARAMTGHNWTGRYPDFTARPEEYGAIHFHDDDLDDADWETDFSWTIPDGLRSGVYAARLRSGAHEDYVPFFVRPKPGTTTARIAVLMPTLSYMAYANEHNSWENNGDLLPFGLKPILTEQDHTIMAHRLQSTYDKHPDGSGVCYSSRLRPILNLRPKYHMAFIRGPHQFCADLCLIDWLEARGFAYDIITDEDLHAEGVDLLALYKVVLTGTHPEYHTECMLDSLETYRDNGGRLMYLGGNGFYWVTSIDPTAPHRVEIRRGFCGTGTWRSEPGECYHSTTGELGGLWRHRGREPQRLVGTGFAAQGFDVSLPYKLQPDSRDPRAAFILEGIDESQPIGAWGLVMDGAAGLEVDRLDFALGTPPHALLIATAQGFSDIYQRVEEEDAGPLRGGTVNAGVRGDMVYFEAENGGAVFSVSSMTWCSSLAENGYANNVSRITENVLKKFVLNHGS